MNVVMTGSGGFVRWREPRGRSVSREAIDQLLVLAQDGIAQLVVKQKQALDWYEWLFPGDAIVKLSILN